jgi:hypothetical protein
MKVSASVMVKASHAVAKAKKEGLLVPKPCERCGEVKVHAHHDDYAKPLDVMWLCAYHHRQRHKELGEPLVEKNGALHVIPFPPTLALNLKLGAIYRGKSVRQYVIDALSRAVKNDAENARNGNFRKAAK